MKERGNAAFGDDLKRAALDGRGHAGSGSEPDAARVVIESVYSDRNRRQTCRLDETGAGRLLVEVHTTSGRQPKAKFRLSAAFLAPEGLPVQVKVTVETGDEPSKPVPRP